MSCYIVERSTLYRALSPVYRATVLGESHITRYVGGLQVEDEYLDLTKTGHIVAILQRMDEANQEAYAARYGERHDLGDEQPFDPFRVQMKLPMIEGYKAMQCWLYQCDEDAKSMTPESVELIDRFRQIEIAIARDIVQAMPEYDAALWG
jgi:hypothetical protein